MALCHGNTEKDYNSHQPLHLAWFTFGVHVHSYISHIVHYTHHLAFVLFCHCFLLPSHVHCFMFMFPSHLHPPQPASPDTLSSTWMTILSLGLKWSSPLASLWMGHMWSTRSLPRQPPPKRNNTVCIAVYCITDYINMWLKGAIEIQYCAKVLGACTEML